VSQRKTVALFLMTNDASFDSQSESFGGVRLSKLTKMFRNQQNVIKMIFSIWNFVIFCLPLQRNHYQHEKETCFNRSVTSTGNYVLPRTVTDVGRI
jgi:hypothetical protein